MTEPIRVYPTETLGLYRTEDGRKVGLIRPRPGLFLWCCQCTQPLSTGVGPHWIIGDSYYCRHCVEVVGQGELL